MMKTRLWLRTVASAALAAVVFGCASQGGGGAMSRGCQPPAKGEAAMIEITPVTDVNPVGTQHFLMATVKDAEGRPVENQRVEWMLARGGVGEIVDVDRWGQASKVDNYFAVSYTANKDWMMDFGTVEPTDDIPIRRGQTWACITSPVEGTSYIIAYCPGIRNWNHHKAFATKHWRDARIDFPPDATNPVGTSHEIVVRATKLSDGTPLVDHLVNFKILSGPAGMLEPGSAPAVSVRTDAQGVARATLRQAQPAEGMNEVEIEVIRPPDDKCCRPAAHLGMGLFRKTWVSPKIAILKTAPPAAVVGETFQYGITVSNDSPIDARDAVVVDVLPDGIEYVASEPACTPEGQKLAWALGTVPGGASRSIMVSVRGTRSGRFQNCADVTAEGGLLTGRSCADTVIGAPALELVKTGPAEVLVCDPITWEITVTNRGDAPARGVRITDSLPEGITTVDGQAGAAFDVGDLGPGESRRVTLATKAVRAGTFENRAQATAGGGLSADAAATTVARQPVLEVRKTGPGRIFLGRNATFEITVTNSGDGPARDTILVDRPPAGTALVNASDGGQLSPEGIVWNLGTLAPGAARTVTVMVTPREKGVVVNAAEARAYCADAKAAEAQTAVEGIPAILLEVIDLEDPIEVGANETYEVVVTNQGSADGTNIRVVCELEPSMQYVSDAGPTPGSASGNTVTFAPLATLAPKAKATWRIVVKAVSPGDVRFRVMLKSDQIDRPVEETEATNFYQ